MNTLSQNKIKPSMNFMKTILPLFCILATISCRNENTNVSTKEKDINTGLPYFFNLERDFYKKKTVQLSSIGKELEYIPLETTSESVLKRINHIEFSNSFIFISDFQRLLQFDRKGKFIRQIGTSGRGPGEYIKVTTFCIDEKKDRIYIIAWGAKSVLEFDFQGNFIRSFQKPFDSGHFVINDTNSFVFQLVDGAAALANDSDFKLYITDINGRPLIKIRNYNKRTSRQGILIGKTPMYFFNDSIRYMQFGNDTLYTVCSGDLNPYAIFNLGKMKMDTDPSIPFQSPGREEVLGELNQRLWIENIIEDNNYMYLELNYGLSDSSATCVVNKKNSETSVLQSGAFQNDIDDGINFWPRYVYKDSILIDYSDAFRILMYIHHMETGEEESVNLINYFKFKGLNKVLTENSNPVLIVLKT